MRYLIYDDKNNLQNIFEKNEKNAVLKLLEILWSKTIVKSKWIKKITYKYNYTNINTIIFTTDNNYKIVFEGVPTKWADLDIYELLKDI